jgi:hypothetical protein
MDPIEWGEDPQTGLLPDLDRLRTMTPTTRAVLVDLTADWVGPLVDAWRDDVTFLADEEDGY